MGIRFYKEKDNRWYADIPSYISEGGVKADLEMVAGADQWLDMIAEGENEVVLELSKTPFIDAEQLILDYVDPFLPEFGAYYRVLQYRNLDFNLRMWLCPVTLYVFGEYPKVIYYK